MVTVFPPRCARSMRADLTLGSLGGWGKSFVAGETASSDGELQVAVSVFEVWIFSASAAKGEGTVIVSPEYRDFLGDIVRAGKGLRIDAANFDVSVIAVTVGLGSDVGVGVEEHMDGASVDVIHAEYLNLFETFVDFVV